MSENIKTIEDVSNAVKDLAGVKIVACENGVLILESQGIPVSIILTDEVIPRLRLSVDVASLNTVNEEKIDELMYKLLDLNTEIDPVAAALESIDPENIVIQARTSLRVVDLQAAEVATELTEFIYTLPAISGVIKEAV